MLSSSGKFGLGKKPEEAPQYIHARTESTLPDDPEVVLAHGWVAKQSIKGRFGKRWTTRYFVLHKGLDFLELRYYETDRCDGATLCGVVALDVESHA